MSPGEFFDAHPIAYGLALAGSVGASVAAATLAGRAASRAQATGLQFLAAITTAEAIGIVISRRAASAHAKTQPLMLV